METNTVERPLRNLDGTALQKDVDDFAKAIGFTGNRLQELHRGAAIAKYDNIAEAIANEQIPNGTSDISLSDEEKAAIQNERGALFKQSRDMYITVIVCAVAALVQGWDQTGSNGANLYWPYQFGLYPPSKGNRSHGWIVGLVNAAPYLAASMIGCVLVDPLNHYFGRRGTIFFAALWCFASVLGAAFTHHWPQLFASRLCLGIGMGAKASTVPIFAAESAPAYWRGSIVMSWQLWVACGIFLGFSANLIVFNTPPHLTWRLQLGSALLPAIPLLILVYLAPESPRWYMKRGTAAGYRKAFEALKRLRNTELQAYRDLYFTFKQLQIEQRDYIREFQPEGQVTAARSRYAVSIFRFTQLFTVSRMRRATLAASTVMLSQQLCGINVLAFYSSTLFAGIEGNQKPGHDEKLQALLYSWGFGLINTLFALPAVKTIDSLGRRPLLLFSVANMAWTMLAAALSFEMSPDDSHLKGVVALFLFLFTAFYSPGQGPVPFTYSAEAYPLSHREAGMGFSVAVNLFFAAVLTVTFPSIRGTKIGEGLGNEGALGLFAGLNVIAFILIFFFVPETRQKTLEELTDVFSKRTRDHMRYQTFEVLPYYARRSLLCSSKRELKDFYEQDSEVRNNMQIDTRQAAAQGERRVPYRVDASSDGDIEREAPYIATTTMSSAIREVRLRHSEDSAHA